MSAKILFLISKKFSICASFLLCLLFLVTGVFAGDAVNPPSGKLDPQAAEILKLILAVQPDPKTTPLSTYNYDWAQISMSFLSAERNGYLSRTEALIRLKGILDFAESVERREGFWFDGYDAQTKKPTNRNVYFQGWWLYAMIVLKNAYPELKPQCERLLAGIDYTGKNSSVQGDHMYNPETKQLIADINSEGKKSYERVLFGQEAGEGRSSYVAYSYLTGDIEPFLYDREPPMQTVEGLKFFDIWEHQNFEFPFLHYEFHDIGYYDKAYKNWQEATRIYMKRCGMWMVPIREWFLYQTWQSDGFPCTEHRESMSFLTWALNPSAPVYEAAWVPGVGLARYYDNWNFYWSALGHLRASAVKLTEKNSLSFPVRIVPELRGNNPAKLNKIRFPFLPSGNPPSLIVSFNNKPVAKIIPPRSAAKSEWRCETLVKNSNVEAVVNPEASGEWCGRTELFDKDSTAPEGTLWFEITGLNLDSQKGFNSIGIQQGPEKASGSIRLLRYDNDIYPVKLIQSLGKGELNLAATSKDWTTGCSGGTECIAGDGPNPNFKYSFTGPSQWAQIGKTGLQLDISSNPELTLEYELTGSASGMEVKLQDADGTVFIIRMPAQTGHHTLKLGPDKFSYAWGGADKVLDTSHIIEAWVVANGNGTGNGTLTVNMMTFKDLERLSQETVPSPAMEIIVNGQREGAENGYAFLARIMAVHNYRVCDELMKDERYFETFVGWVGPYSNSVELARWVHNLGDNAVEVEYILPRNQAGNKVKITDRKTGTVITVKVSDGKAFWTIPPHKTHHVSLK
jgi:hypothetical protein